jgi:hypothetical protein
MSASSGAGIASNSATSTIESVGTLVGPLLAAALVSLSDNGVVFVVGAGALLAAALLLGRVRIETRVDLTAEPSDLGTLQIIGAGFGAVSRSPNARLLVGLAVAQTFVRGCLNVLIVIAVFGVLHGSAAEVGYLTAAIGVGGLIGALGAMALEGRRLAALFGLALVTWGVPIILIAPRPYLIVMVFLLAIVGAANSVEDVALFTLFQRIVPDEILTRVLGVVWGLAMGAVAIGSIAAPAIAAVILTPRGTRPVRSRRRGLNAAGHRSGEGKPFTNRIVLLWGKETRFSCRLGAVFVASCCGGWGEESRSRARGTRAVVAHARAGREQPTALIETATEACARATSAGMSLAHRVRLVRRAHAIAAMTAVARPSSR